MIQTPPLIREASKFMRLGDGIFRVGAKNFGLVAKGGGRKILDFKFFGILRKNKGTRIQSFAQIRSFARDIRICGIWRPPNP